MLRVGPLGLGDATVQLGDPHVCVGVAVPRLGRIPPPEIAAENADGTLACSQAADASDSILLGPADLSANYGWVIFAAGLLILLLAPVLGQQADARGNKKRWVVLGTAAARADPVRDVLRVRGSKFFWFGAAAVALASVASEIAGVSYNAMLYDVSTRRRSAA